MAFELVSPVKHSIWCPVEDAVTVYNGQIVEMTGAGVECIDVASGAYDTTGNTLIAGLVIGNNNKTQLYSATYKSYYITGVTSQANLNAREWFSVEGPWSKGDAQPMVEVIPIYADTKIKAPLFNAALWTAPTVLTETTGNAAGTTITTNATQFTPAADLCTIYCRSGANSGQYRVTTDASTTAATVDRAFQNAIAIGDKFVRVPLRPFGDSLIYIDALAMYIDVSLGLATNYYGINVLSLDLSEAGKENVVFTFNLKHLIGSAAD
jgi:hypothetical protein